MKKVFIQIAVSTEEKKLIVDQAARENYRNLAEYIRKTLLDRAAEKK